MSYLRLTRFCVDLTKFLSLQVLKMPAVVLEFELPRLPQSWEDGMDLALARMKRLRKRARINLSRRMAIIRAGFRDLVEGLRREDERPIIKKGEIRHPTMSVIMTMILGSVRFDEVNLN